MSGLSETTQTLIDQAHRIARAPAPPASAERDLVDALTRIADTAEVLAIPRIISLVLDRRPAIAAAAGAAIAKLRRHIAVRDVGMFDRVFREPSSFSPERIAWRQLQAPRCSSSRCAIPAATFAKPPSGDPRCAPMAPRSRSS